ncbi:macro domain-containing protein [Paenibacillus sp. FSL L8-0436]|uniref:macro domain-containing protein n=1 Tax=Paenibacillus sp. FSL L8-0436 TaxID=2954686 RepID=UPI0031591DFE
MKYNEIYRDLFEVGNDYFLAHCISSDAKMGAGIAVQFKKRFGLGNLQKEAKQTPLKIGSCVIVGRVLNLVTKKVYWGKPTYETFTNSIEDMKRVAMDNGINKIAMPQIGAGLDRLSWSKNREIIQQVFKDIDIEILVCRFK